jgi:hypothetical protein
LLRAAANSERNRKHHVRLSVRRHRWAGRLASNRGGMCFVYGDANRGKFRAVHSGESEKVAAIVNNRDIHGDIYFQGAAFGGREDCARAFESQLRMVASEERHVAFLKFIDGKY